MVATISFMKEELPSDLHSTCNLLLFSISVLKAILVKD